jgi:hypothetical protein
METKVYEWFWKANGNYSVIIEDDGRVAYGYLLRERCIIGDVWLYNTTTTPSRVRWEHKKEMPFLNSAHFVQENVAPLRTESEAEIRWEGYEEPEHADIYIRGQFVARLKSGWKPGWSALVKADGPLARKLAGPAKGPV